MRSEQSTVGGVRPVDCWWKEKHNKQSVTTTKKRATKMCVSVYLLVDTKGGERKTELESSFLYVLVRLFSYGNIARLVFWDYDKPFSLNSSKFLPFRPSLLGRRGHHGPGGSNFSTKVVLFCAITLTVVGVGGPVHPDCCRISTHPIFVQILEETLQEQETYRMTLFYGCCAVVVNV